MTEVPHTLHDGRYRVVGVLGEGAQATTLDAVDVRSGLAVAVKCFRVHGARSWKEVELAEREAAVLASLSHPLLPRYVEHFEDRGELFLVIEKIEGESLSALRRRGVPFDEAEVTRLLRDAASALGYLHGRTPPIVHRDLKPSNVLRRPDGSFAFIDFGSVRDRMKPEGGSTVVGTFGYMAPEQFQGRAMPASDVYAIGATALALLTGREPEELPHRGLGIDVSAALAGFRVRPELVRTLSAMLVPAPDERVQVIGLSVEPEVPEIEEADQLAPAAPAAEELSTEDTSEEKSVAKDTSAMNASAEKLSAKAPPREIAPQKKVTLRDGMEMLGLGSAAYGALIWWHPDGCARFGLWAVVTITGFTVLLRIVAFLLQGFNDVIRQLTEVLNGLSTTRSQGLGTAPRARIKPGDFKITKDEDRANEQPVHGWGDRPRRHGVNLRYAAGRDHDEELPAPQAPAREEPQRVRIRTAETDDESPVEEGSEASNANPRTMRR